MAIFNMSGGGGENLTYKVEISKTRPENPSNNKHILWIKDDLTNLTPYNKNIQPVIPSITFETAYLNATTSGATNKKTSKFVTDHVLYLHGSETKSMFAIAINSQKPYILLRLNKKTGDTYQKITIGLTKVNIAEGVKVYSVSTCQRKDETTSEYVLTHSNDVSYSIHSQNETYVYIQFIQEDLTDTDGLFKYIVMNYDTTSTAVPKYSQGTSSVPASAGTDLTLRYNGDIKNNIVIADANNEINSAYIMTESSKCYKIYKKNNTDFSLFTIDKYPTYQAVPAEGCEGRLIRTEEETNTYCIVNGKDYSNICFCWNVSEEQPIIEDYTYGYNVNLAYNKDNPISLNYAGYYVNNFEPEDLMSNTTNNKLWIWFLAGNNYDINFKSSKSRNKQHFISINSALAYLHLKNSATEYLYYLKGAFYNKDTQEWYDFVEDASMTDDLIKLVEGDLVNFYNQKITKVTDYAFYQYSNLKSINLENCNTLGTSAFRKCANLEVVNLPAWDDNRIQYLTATTTDSSPFAECPNIHTANIGFTAICGPSDMGTEITINTNKTHKTGYSPFNSARAVLTNLSLPKCSLINSSAFIYYTSLNKLTFGSPIDAGKSAFFGCTNLEIINNCDNLQRVRTGTFANCVKLDNINLINADFISPNAFSGCTQLTTIGEMPKANYIGSGAFLNTNISSFIAPNCLHFSQGSDALTVLRDLTIAKSPFSNCRNLQNIEIGISCGTEPYRLPAIFIGDNFPSLRTLKLPNVSKLNAPTAANASKAAYGCFRNLSYLSYVRLSSDLTKIENAAFKNCAILNQDNKKAVLLNGQNVYEYLYENENESYKYGDKNEDDEWIYNPNYIQYNSEPVNIEEECEIQQIERNDNQIYNIVNKKLNKDDILYTYTTKEENDVILIKTEDNNYIDIYIENLNDIKDIKIDFSFCPNRKYQVKTNNLYHYAENKFAQKLDKFGNLEYSDYTIDENGIFIYDTSSEPIYDEERPLYDLTKPIIYEALYSDDYLYEKEIDPNGDPILNSQGQFNYINEANQYYGLKYINYSQQDPFTGEIIYPEEGLRAPGISNIGILAFTNCSNLHEFNMSMGDGTIGASAFSNCINLTKVNAPLCSNVDITAFNNCPAITYLNLSNASFTYGNNNNLQSFFNTITDNVPTPKYPLLQEVYLNRASTLKTADTANPNNNWTIPNACFKNLTMLRAASFEQCKVIGEEAFQGTAFKYLNTIDDNKLSENLNIPSVEIIKQAAFRDCISLVEGCLPDSTTEIGASCFENCRNLTKIFGNKNEEESENILYLNKISTIGANAFKACAGTNDNGESIGITEVIIPNTVTSIGDNAFNGCTQLTDLSFDMLEKNENDEYPTTLTIGTNAFFNCPFTYVTIPAHTVLIKNGAFAKNEGTYTIDLTNFESINELPTLEALNEDAHNYHAFGITQNGQIANYSNIIIKVKSSLVNELKNTNIWKAYASCFSGI